jgi:Spy/CpxP family protein refolding chaperone
MRRKVGPLVVVAALAGCATTSEHAGHGATPYAGQQSRDIKALSADEARGYAEGAGMGLAKAAELNGYPGPMHALENGDALGLTPEQRGAIEAFLRKHKAEARALGEDVLRLERELDALFASHRPTADAVDRTLAELAVVQARLRASHLKAHLATTALLTADQIERYNGLRGYKPHQ